MSNKRNRGINYNGAFGGGIIRPVEEVEAERTALEAAEQVPPSPGEPSASEPDSTLASKPETIAAIRKVVKRPGREVSFVRLSPEEKAELADVVYAFKRAGLKTTENEVNRIAINALLEDHRQRGEGSILARTIAALRD